VSEFAEPGHPHDGQVLLVIRFQSGPDGYIRVPPYIVAEVSATQSMMKFVRQRQACGELPPGEAVRIIRVH